MRREAVKDRIVARMLVEKWGSSTAGKFDSAVHANALIALSLAAHFLAGNSSTYAPLFLTIVEKHVRRVVSLRPKYLSDRLLQAVSLLYASLAFRTPVTLRDDTYVRFNDLINRVILPDGGHISRNPHKLFETLQHLVPLRDAMKAHHLAIPQTLSAAIERMLPMLRMVSHGDQGLAGFQGAGATAAASIKTFLEFDTAHGRPLLLAPHSGYCRLAHRSSLLIVDVGHPAMCNSALALEFSDGPNRILSNCGMPLSASPAWQEAASGLAAHNTLEVEGFSCLTTSTPSTEVINTPRGSLAKCRNHIAGKAGHVTHERTLFLSQDGRDLRGEESISPSGHSYTVRFHLHPSVKASLVRNGVKIVLVLPNRAAWAFTTRGGNVSLEESIYLADADGPRKTQQIVIRGTLDSPATLKWALRRVEKSTAAEGERQDAPQLPF